MHGKNPVGIVALGPDDLPHTERRRDRTQQEDRYEKRGRRRWRRIEGGSHNTS